MWIDSHCHLNHERNDEGMTPAQIVESARAAGVHGMVNISCEIKGDFPTVLETAGQFENVWCTIGTHPHDASNEQEKSVTLEELITLANSDDKIIGIGESGLDYYYNHSPVEDQKACFRKHIRACIETGLPLVVHARDADEDIISILKEEGANTSGNSPLKGVMHCFSSGRGLAEQALELGFYISFSGIITFKNAQDLRDICADVPLDRMLVETDAPFLAPVPYRGKTNMPTYVPYVGEKIAEIHGKTVEDISKITTESFCRLFGVEIAL